jgi:hypothetical protein
MLFPDLHHPFVHGLHDTIFGSFQPSILEPATGKVIVLRDYVPQGSLRDRLCDVRVPLKGREEKYVKDGRPIAECEPAQLKSKKKLAEPLHLLLIVKQILTAMVFLESIGMKVDFVHCGNVLILSDGRSSNVPACVSISDFENGLLGFASGIDHSVAPSSSTADGWKVANLRAFGHLLYELTSGKSPPTDPAEKVLGAWPPPDFHVASRSAQKILLGIFAPGEPYAQTGSVNDSYSCLAEVLACEALAEVPLREEHLNSLPEESDIAKAKARHEPMLAAVRREDAEGAFVAAETWCVAECVHVPS